MLVSCTWAWGLFWSVVCIPSETPLEKTDFSFVSSSHLVIASRFRPGACVCFPVLALGHHLPWTYAGPVRVATVSEFIVHRAYLSGDHCFLGDLHPLWLLKISVPTLLHSTLSPEVEGFDEDIPLRIVRFKVSHSLHPIFPSTSGGIFLDDGWVRYWSMNIAWYHYESFDCYIHSAEQWHLVSP